MKTLPIPLKTLNTKCGNASPPLLVDGPGRARASAAKRARERSRATRKHGLSNNARARIAREMRNGAGHKLCRELQTSAQAHEKCTKDETARKMCKAVHSLKEKSATVLVRVGFVGDLNMQSLSAKGFWTFPQIQYHQSLKISFTLYTCTLN